VLSGVYRRRSNAVVLPRRLVAAAGLWCEESDGQATCCTSNVPRDELHHHQMNQTTCVYATSDKTATSVNKVTVKS